MSSPLPFLKQTTLQKQTQRLMALPQMQQAFQLMQLPVLELAALVEYHLEQNPIIAETTPIDEEALEKEESEPELAEENEEKELTLEENDFTTLRELEDDFKDYLADWGNQTKNQIDHSAKNLLEQTVKAVPTLFECLMKQAYDSFNSPEELAIAEMIIGNLNSEGYFTTPLTDFEKNPLFSLEKISHVLKTIQTFEPYGIAASCLQESLLLQLHGLGKEDTLAAHIIKDHFDDLIHHRLPNIQRALNCSHQEIDIAIQNHIAHLDFHPATSYNNTIVQPIIADVTLYEEGDELLVRVNDDYLPSIHLNQRYLQMLRNNSETTEVKDFLHGKLTSAKWLIRNIFQRNDTLKKLVLALAKEQKNFFLNANGKLIPMTMKFLAAELGVHESTITRAVANKYLDCPRGLLPLKSFFSIAYNSKDGDNISAHTIREALLKLIHNEDKRHALSDAKLSILLEKEGIICARRTIAKYRVALKIGNAQQRKKFHD